MLKVYVISASNLPPADSNGKSDPYVVLYSVDKNRFRFGKTQTINETLDPVWDPLLKKPFTCPFTRARSIVFDIYDKDTLSKDDFLGTAEFDLQIHPIGQPVTLDVDNQCAKTKRPPKIVVEVDYPAQIFPEDKNIKIHHLTFSLSYDPLIPLSTHSHPPELSFIAIHEETKLLERIYRGMTPPAGLMYDSTPQHVGPTGRTQVVRINLGKCKNITLVPLVSSNLFRGKITVQYCGFAKEPVKDDIRVVDKKELNCGTLISQSSVQTIDDGLYSLGSLIKITNGQYTFTEFEGTQCKTNYLEFANTFGSDYTGFSQRYNISFEQSYSLNAIAEFHGISIPDEITFGLGWSGAKDLDTFALTLDGKYHVIGKVSASKPKFENCIYHHGDAKKGVEGGDAEQISVKLSKCPSTIKSICIFANYKAGKLCDVQNVYMRMISGHGENEGKELIYLPIVARKKQDSLLFAVLYPTKKGSWELFPAARLFESGTPDGAKDYIEEFFEISGIVEDVIEE